MTYWELHFWATCIAVMEDTNVLICLMKHMIANQTVSMKKLLEIATHLQLLHEYHFVCLCVITFSLLLQEWWKTFRHVCQLKVFSCLTD